MAMEEKYAHKESTWYPLSFTMVNGPTINAMDMGKVSLLMANPLKASGEMTNGTDKANILHKMVPNTLVTGRTINAMAPYRSSIPTVKGK